MSAVIVMVTMVALYYVDQWLEQQEFEALIAAEPSAEIKQAAALMIGPAKQLIAEVPEAIVKDPIDSQILDIERVVEAFL